jgi:hypothetical protein
MWEEHARECAHPVDQKRITEASETEIDGHQKSLRAGPLLGSFQVACVPLFAWQYAKKERNLWRILFGLSKAVFGREEDAGHENT